MNQQHVGYQHGNESNIPAAANLVRADTVKPGDMICFKVPHYNFIVEEVESHDRFNVAFRANDNSMYSAFENGALLFVVRARHLH